MATTYETSSWDTYGKWTLIALILAMFIAALIATAWGWEQGYFDTIIPTRCSNKSISSRQRQATQSLNFSSYRSTMNAQLQGGVSLLPMYSPRVANPSSSTPEPTYKTGTPTVEQQAQGVCPLPIASSPSINNESSGDGDWTIEDDIPPPEPAIRSNPWETVTSSRHFPHVKPGGSTSRKLLRPVENTITSHGSKLRASDKTDEASSIHIHTINDESSTISDMTSTSGTGTGYYRQSGRS